MGKVLCQLEIMVKYSLSEIMVEKKALNLILREISSLKVESMNLEA